MILWENHTLPTDFMVFSIRLPGVEKAEEGRSWQKQTTEKLEIYQYSYPPQLQKKRKKTTFLQKKTGEYNKFFTQSIVNSLSLFTVAPASSWAFSTLPPASVAAVSSTISRQPESWGQLSMYPQKKRTCLHTLFNLFKQMICWHQFWKLFNDIGTICWESTKLKNILIFFMLQFVNWSFFHAWKSWKAKTSRTPFGLIILAQKRRCSNISPKVNGIHWLPSSKRISMVLFDHQQ